MRVPVLTYHGIHVLANEYAQNDHIALAEDLRVIHRLGLRVVPLHRVAEAVVTGDDRGLERTVAISFDDGSWFDWHDLDHPTCGPQRSFANILRDFRAETGAEAHATSFVIVSPDARTILDRTCMVGRGWWGDEWWPEAAAEDLVAIESHSWDHNHDTLEQTAQRDGRCGTFRSIETWPEADAELRQASDWLDGRCPSRRTSLFAFPYGETSEYLVREYLPRHASEHRLRAAFTSDPAPVMVTSNRWALPRFVCRRDWRDPAGLERVLRDAWG
jgi:peptidoglycan/xylan/chitin deacetylase (PgdA/CDA1 family)